MRLRSCSHSKGRFRFPRGRRDGCCRSYRARLGLSWFLRTKFRLEICLQGSCCAYLIYRETGQLQIRGQSQPPVAWCLRARRVVRYIQRSRTGLVPLVLQGFIDSALFSQCCHEGTKADNRHEGQFVTRDLTGRMACTKRNRRRGGRLQARQVMQPSLCVCPGGVSLN